MERLIYCLFTTWALSSSRDNLFSGLQQRGPKKRGGLDRTKSSKMCRTTVITQIAKFQWQTKTIQNRSHKTEFSCWSRLWLGEAQRTHMVGPTLAVIMASITFPNVKCCPV